MGPKSIFASHLLLCIIWSVAFINKLSCPFISSSLLREGGEGAPCLTVLLLSLCPRGHSSPSGNVAARLEQTKGGCFQDAEFLGLES